MSDVLFFDAFTEIGAYLDKHPAESWRLDQLLAEMNHCSISGALVASRGAVNYDAMFGNLALSDAIRPHSNLFAVWHVMPHQTRECPAPAELAKKMRQHNVRAVIVRPKTLAWDWQAEHAQPLFRWLAKERILTIVDRHEFDHFRELDQFLSANRRLPLLLVGASNYDQRFLPPLLMKYRNLHTSFDGLQVHYGIEWLVDEGLANQLVFASAAPKMSIGAHRTYIDYAEVSPAVRQKIAGGNLVRLLHGQKPPSVVVNKDEDVLMAAARQGKPLPTLVIDMHMHIVHDGLNNGGLTLRAERGDLEGIMHMAGRLGYSGGGFMSFNGPMGDSRTGNELLAELAGRLPRGYWGLPTFDPGHYTQAELKAAIPQLYRDGRFIGMKPYNHYPKDYRDPLYAVWWKFGNQNKLYGLIDRNFTGDFREVEDLAKRYPRVPWVIAHTGRDFKRADQAGEVAAKYKNVNFEICLPSVPLGMIDYLVERCGQDRIVYGSDMPVLDARQPLGWVVYSRLPLAVKKKVLGENALRVLRPCRSRLPVYNRPPGL